MEIFSKLLLTIVTALVGSYIGRKLRISAGTLVGAILSVGILSVCTGLAYLPIKVKIATKIAAGAYVGSRIGRQDIVNLRKAALPAAITIVLMLLSSVAFGVIMYLATGTPLVTALFMSAPGGMTDITLLSLDYEGANSAVIAVAQVIRMAIVVSLFPHLMRFVVRKAKLARPVYITKSTNDEHKSVAPRNRSLNTVLTLLVATVAGLIAEAMRVPAGALMFSMIGVSVYNILTHNAYLPKPMRYAAQSAAGALIGVTLTLDALKQLKTALPATVLLMVMYAVNTAVLAGVLYRFGKLDYTTAFCGCMPGGAQDLALVIGDYGAHMPTASVIQMARVICVIAFYPMLINLVLMIAGQ